VSSDRGAAKAVGTLEGFAGPLDVAESEPEVTESARCDPDVDKLEFLGLLER